MLALLLAVELVSRLDVTLAGPGWTSKDAIRRLMSTRVGSDASELDRDLVRLRTLGVLYDVSARSEDGADGKRIEVFARDRWTLLPLLGFRRGGGRTTSRFGISDYNAFGRLFTLYGELNSNADIPFVNKTSADRIGSFVWVDVPRIFGTRLQPGLSWSRDFLDFATFRDGGVAYVYDRARYDLRFETRYELTDLITLMIGADARRDRYRTSIVSPAEGSAPRSGDTTSALLGVQIGYIEQFISQARGKELRLVAEASRAGVLGSDFGALSGTLLARGYFLPAPRHNICLQLLLQATSGQEESFFFHSGGLREIRGFTDAYFSGAFMARANAEWRADVFRIDVVVPWVGQIAAFTDGGYVGRRQGSIAGLDYEGAILSIGAGVRAIPVPFARAVGRIDVATGLAPRRTIDVSFSGQQFF